MTRITWSKPTDALAMQRGTVGSLPTALFVIECLGEGDFILRTPLLASPTSAASREAAQDAAERYLTHFLRRLGAEWVER